MKKLVAVLCLSLVVLIPATTQAFTLYSPVFTDRRLVECNVLNVGNIVLQAAPFWIGNDGIKVPAAPQWVDLAPGLDVSSGMYPAPLKSCGFWVRAKSPRRTATRAMVRGVVQAIDNDGRRVAMELK